MRKESDGEKVSCISYLLFYLEQVYELGFKRKVCICQHVIKVGINLIILTGLRLFHSFHLKIRVDISCNPMFTFC